MKKYSVAAVAKEFGVSERTIYRKDTSGEFRALTYETGAKYYTEEMLNDYFKGIYSVDKLTQYRANAIELVPFSIEVDLSRLTQLGVNPENSKSVTYYDIKEFSPIYSVLRVASSTGSTEKTYQIGEYKTQNGKVSFEHIIQWIN